LHCSKRVHPFVIASCDVGRCTRAGGRIQLRQNHELSAASFLSERGRVTGSSPRGRTQVATDMTRFCQGGEGETGKVAAAIDHSDIRGSEPHFKGSPESASDNGRGLGPPLWIPRIRSGLGARLSFRVS
jgi:hypothetical protein